VPLPPPPSGGGYKSLTGPGQTATPGALTQAGLFTISQAPFASTIYVYTGPPTGVVDADAYGALCIDITTPALWISYGSGTTDWIRVTNISAGTVTTVSSPDGSIAVTTTPHTTPKLTVVKALVDRTLTLTIPDLFSVVAVGYYSGSVTLNGDAALAII
jgi:hypothetical protein